jgi:hypothetical protein
VRLFCSAGSKSSSKKLVSCGESPNASAATTGMNSF